MSARPHRHTDSTRPAQPTSHRGPRNTTRPTQTRARRTQNRTDREPVPITVWTPTEETRAPDTTWPTTLVTQLVEALSKPDDHVLLLPTPANPQHQYGTAGVGSLAETEDTVREHGRRVSTVLLDPPAAARASSADKGAAGALLEHPTSHSANTDPLAAPPGEHRDEQAPQPHLILTHLVPEAAEPPALEHLAAAAAHRLAPGGTFAVLTHSDHVGDRLRDPSGLVVAAGQRADLLYLQHLVLLLTPVRDGQLTPTNSSEDAPAPPRHRRTHADALLFVHPTSAP